MIKKSSEIGEPSGYLNGWPETAMQNATVASGPGPRFLEAIVPRHRLADSFRLTFRALLRSLFLETLPLTN
jgi:hypothetical protein